MKVAKLSKLEKAAVARMPEIVAATQAGSFVYAEPFDVQYLLDNEWIEQNADYSNPENAVEIATRATQKGIADFTETVASATNTTAEQPKTKGNTKMSFEILDGIELPKLTRAGGATRQAMYPFDKLEVGQSFFVPATEKKPEPWKSLSSSISTAQHKYAEEIPGETREVRNPRTGVTMTVPAIKYNRKFVAREYTNAAGEKGALVQRTV